MPPEMSTRLTAFVDAAPVGSLRALTVLASAESLTDELALHLIKVACPEQAGPDILVSALHLSGFVVERNSEWHISGDERSFLNNELVKHRDLFSLCHTYLAYITDAEEPTLPFTEIPSYLRGPVGKAYHHT